LVALDSVAILSANMSVAHAHKTALITGACGGLGRAIAERFLQEGANVVVCDVNDKLIESFRGEVSAAYPECTLVLKLDVTSDTDLDELFAQGEKVFGKINFVVNNCGIMDRFDPAGDTERSLWDKVIAVNLTAPAMVTKRAVNTFSKHGTRGSIVNISSIAGIR
jgi:NAD(P)-dependent dehydrogenase (short-subunit alcohol dehydrogenase family)